MKRRDKCKAILASDGYGNGVILVWEGKTLSVEVEEEGFREIDDLGLGDAPEGISVWEGVYRQVYYQDEDERGSEPLGTFRAPNDLEWEWLKKASRKIK